MTTHFGDRLDRIMSPPTCPLDGKEARLFKRLGNELVCDEHFPRPSMQGAAGIGVPAAAPARPE